MTPAERRAELGRLAIERRNQLVSVKRQGPACLFCVYGPERSSKGICNHPLFVEVSRNPATHEGQARALMSTMTARADHGMCGPEAELFEPRPALSRAWRALRPHLSFLLGPV